MILILLLNRKAAVFRLATVHSIIRNNAGYITVESKVGVGTIFYVYLPAVEGEITSTQEKAPNAYSRQGPNPVDGDEEMVRKRLGGYAGETRV